MPALLAAQERHDLSLLALATVGCAAAQPQPLTASLAAETGAQGAKSRVLAWLVEDGVVDVGHRAEGMCSTGALVG